MEYTVTTVVEKERADPILGGILGTDRVLLVAVGKVQAGVDMTQIDESDVQIDGTTIKLVLPPAEVISVELLPEESTIYESDRSWLFSEYEGLELEALEEARAQLMASAESNQGMLDLAEKFARLQLEEFLRKVGFEEIEITFGSTGD
jgi:hypothetical protein